jgi:hypothetical protein
LANSGLWLIPSCKLFEIVPDNKLTTSESNDPEVISQFAWIPEMMLLSLLKRDVTSELRLVPSRPTRLELMV